MNLRPRSPLSLRSRSPSPRPLVRRTLRHSRPTIPFCVASGRSGWTARASSSWLPRSSTPSGRGSPAPPIQRNAQDWLVSMYKRWGIEAKNEQYGTWRGWRRGTSHVDLVSPRVRTLEATMLGFSPGTGGTVAHRRHDRASALRRQHGVRALASPGAREARARVGAAGHLPSHGGLGAVRHAGLACAHERHPRRAYARVGATPTCAAPATRWRSAAASSACVSRRRGPRASSRRAPRTRTARARSSRRTTRAHPPSRSAARTTASSTVSPSAARSRGCGSISTRACSASSRCSTPSPRSPAPRSPTSTSCSRRTSTRGTARPARPTTAPAPS